MSVRYNVNKRSDRKCLSQELRLALGTYTDVPVHDFRFVRASGWANAPVALLLRIHEDSTKHGSDNVPVSDGPTMLSTASALHTDCPPASSRLAPMLLMPERFDRATCASFASTGTLAAAMSAAFPQRDGTNAAPVMVCSSLPRWAMPLHPPTHIGTFAAARPAWFNNASVTQAVLPDGRQVGATGGLHAVHHVPHALRRLQACPPFPLPARAVFEAWARGLDANPRKPPAQLQDPIEEEYTFTMLHTCLDSYEVACFVTTPSSVACTLERSTIFGGCRGNRIFDPFAAANGDYRCGGYLVRMPIHHGHHKGHWIALVPPIDACIKHGSYFSDADHEAILCDSLQPRPYLLTLAEVHSVLAAASSNAAPTAASSFDAECVVLNSVPRGCERRPDGLRICMFSI